MSDSAQKVISAGLVVASFFTPVGWAAALVTVGSIIYGAASQRQAKAEAERKSAEANAAARQAFLDGLKDRTATSIGTEQPHTTIYGLNKVGGSIVAMFPSGPHDEFKTCVVVFANHRINAYTKFWVAGKFVGPRDGAGWVTGGNFYDGSAVSASAQFVTSVTLDENYVPGSVNVYYANADSSTSSKPIAYTLTGNILTVTPGASAVVSYQYIRKGAPSDSVSYSGAPSGGAYSSGALNNVSPESKEASRLRVLPHLGIPGEAADATLTANFPTKWTSQHTLEGHAYCVFTLDLRQAEFQGGPPSFQAEIEGKKLYDPRTGLTTYSDNNALVLLDYLTGPYLKIPLNALPISDYIAAANDCDDIVRTGAVAPQSNKRYTLNGVISANESPKKVLEQIALSMCGTIDGNSWSVYAGKYRAPVMTLTQDDVVGGLSITPGLGYQGTYNTVRGQYVSPANDYTATDFPPFVNSAYLTADGQEISTDSHQPYTNNVTGIYSIERIKMEDSRNGLLLSGDFSYRTWPLRPGDRVTFTSDLLGMSNKIFRVTDKSVKFGSPVRLALKEDAPSIWDQLNSLVADATLNTSLTDPFAIPLLPALTATSGTSTLLRAASGEILSRVLLSWQPVNYQGTSTVDVEWRRHVSSSWEALTVTATNPSTYLTGVIDGEGYVIRARLRALSLNAVGAWSYIDHRVVGKSEPPPDVMLITADNRTLTWTPVDVTDLAGYLLAFNYGTNIDWNAATPLNTGIITESPYTLPNSISGQVTVLIKAADTTGNLSKNAAAAYTVLDAPYLNNIIQTTDYGSLGYPGTVVGGVVIGNTVYANALDSFYGSDNSTKYGQVDLESFYSSASSSYGQVVYTTPNLFIPNALLGSNLSLALDMNNSLSHTLEYRAIDLTSFYDVGSNSFYGLDSDSFYTDSTETWLTWPGQVSAKNSVYKFRVTLAQNSVAQPTLQSFIVILDAPDLVETLDDITISSSGTVVPYTLAFTQIKNIQATLNANAVGGVTVEVDKPTLTVKVYNAAHTAVSGATVDLLLRGY